MLASRRLRLDPGDGSPVTDYRIEDGRIQYRMFYESASAEAESLTAEMEENWHELTPQELTTHVLAKPVLARWLRRRMGIFSLVRACNSDDSPAITFLGDPEFRKAA